MKVTHSAKRTVNYLFYGLSYAYSIPGRNIYSIIINASIDLMSVTRVKNAYFDTIPSLLL